MLEVVTLIVPRHERWLEYLPLLDLQRRTVEKFGHRHVVMTEGAPAELAAYNTLPAVMDANLMRAIIDGQIAYLEQWSGAHPAVLVDIDCLIARDLAAAFDGTFDIGLTNRPNPANPKSPINNGAMYIAAGCRDKALAFFKRARAYCEEHWGGDQEAIAKACRPVPNHYGIELRDIGGLQIRFGFLSMLFYNCVPNEIGRRHKKNPFVVHFKGDRKEWMRPYAKSFIL